MPKIWAETIDTHRRQVVDAILDATAELMAEHGAVSVAMANVAERAGIGRATLYKYFPDMESILVAWHERHFGGHLERLRAFAEADPLEIDDLKSFVRDLRRHQPKQSHRGAVGTIAHSVAATRGLPGSVERDVLKLLASVLGRLADRNIIRNDLPAEALARWFVHGVHASPDLHDEAAAELLTSSLAPRPPRRQRSRRAE